MRPISFSLRPCRAASPRHFETALPICLAGLAGVQFEISRYRNGEPERCGVVVLFDDRGAEDPRLDVGPPRGEALTVSESAICKPQCIVGTAMGGMASRRWLAPFVGGVGYNLAEKKIVQVLLTISTKFCWP
jgi:hypothetical protein